MPFFVIFRLAREKLLVTVALDHPVCQNNIILYIRAIFKHHQIYLVTIKTANTEKAPMKFQKIFCPCRGVQLINVLHKDNRV